MYEIDSDIAGRWWKASDYHIEEGTRPGNLPPHLADFFRYIRPTPGATIIDYAPQIKGLKDQRNGSGNLLVVSLEALRDLDLEDETAILEWCRRYGLLGILPQTVLWIRLAPRWQAVPSDGQGRTLFPTQLQHFRTNVGWSAITRSKLSGEMEYRIEIDEEHSFDEWNDRVIEKEDSSLTSGVVVAPLFSSQFEEKDLSDALGPYFPSIQINDRSTAKYPMPITPEFWVQYGESVAQFRSAIQGFRDAVGKMANIGPLAGIPDEAFRLIGKGRSEIHSLLSVNPALGIEEQGEYSPRWAFSSLLAMFAFSVWQHLIGGSSVKHCRRIRCRKVFLSQKYSQDYCSPKCRRNEERQRNRNKRKGAKP